MFYNSHSVCCSTSTCFIFSSYYYILSMYNVLCDCVYIICLMLVNGNAHAHTSSRSDNSDI